MSCSTNEDTDAQDVNGTSWAVSSYPRACSIDKSSDIYVNCPHTRHRSSTSSFLQLIQSTNRCSNTDNTRLQTSNDRVRQSPRWYDCRLSATGDTTSLRPVSLQHEITFDVDRSPDVGGSRVPAALTRTKSNISPCNVRRVTRRPSTPPPLPPVYSLAPPSAGTVLRRRHSGDVVLSRQATSNSTQPATWTSVSHCTRAASYPRQSERQYGASASAVSQYADIQRHSSSLSPSRRLDMMMMMMMGDGGGRGLVTSHRAGEDVEIQLSCDNSLTHIRRQQTTRPPSPRLSTFHCLHRRPPLPAHSHSTAAKRGRLNDTDTELTSQLHCPDIVISYAADTDHHDVIDDDITGDDVTRVERVSSVFDALVRQHSHPSSTAATLNDVISDVTRLRDVTHGGDLSHGSADCEVLASECRQLAVDCRQLVSSVFYCSTDDVTVNATRALRSLSAVVRQSRELRAPALLVSNVGALVAAYQATVTAAKDAVDGPTAGQLQLTNFIKEASTLARVLQLILNSFVHVKAARTDY